MNFREYCRYRKSEKSASIKKKWILGAGIFLPIVCFTWIALAKPVELLQAATNASYKLGFTKTHQKLHLYTARIKSEKNVSNLFDDTAIWIEIPKNYSSVFASSYLDLSPPGSNVAFFPSSKTTYKVCVPERLNHHFTKAALDDYAKKSGMIIR